ncbi:MAG: 16S rRNA (uracil(1498)-N(3))-methyltransferase [Firmicutes bacterium HGW-Firmicutes-21]|nr:MAG: 16S rRNA (uracil(1498)-N(3))-methyltransferase [Firmicutes bacterium HGW-Firmicutes-21]
MSSVPRIFITQDSIIADTVRITGSDAAHIIKVLRLNTGDKLRLCDMRRTEYDGIITETSDNALIVALGEGRSCVSELPFEVTLYQGVPKGDKLDTIVQKAVELGVSTVIPVLCERSVSRPDNRAFEKKLERYNKIAVSAASQCGRGIIPAVLPPLSFINACREMKQSEVCFICYEGSETIHIRDYLREKKPRKIAFLIGPEGGLSTGEIRTAGELGIPLIGLGGRILRTETASGFVLSAISILLE